MVQVNRRDAVALGLSAAMLGGSTASTAREAERSAIDRRTRGRVNGNTNRIHDAIPAPSLAQGLST
ncbi:hypothetical protein [Rhodococcus sp. 06-470-2]|uniref:hypothetical protein n=1 Tax=Rhodococcus sp. 06-470-2 TaxID=2022509 RepID=UPI0011401042|nr:hypothetical protein [Rhodococcus sp. 06-470-2]